LFCLGNLYPQGSLSATANIGGAGERYDGISGGKELGSSGGGISSASDHEAVSVFVS
jgi:hypothetical protein